MGRHTGALSAHSDGGIYGGNGNALNRLDRASARITGDIRIARPVFVFILMQLSQLPHSCHLIRPHETGDI